MVPELFLLFDFICAMFRGEDKSPAPVIPTAETPSHGSSDNPAQDAEQRNEP
jgi:hypothetical protein